MAERAATLDRAAPWAVLEFRAMGSRCRIVAPSADLAERGRMLVDALERSWTRFRDDSELARLNANSGRVCLVSPHLLSVLRVAEQAHRLSRGRFDVRCLASVERAGYDRSWDSAPGSAVVRDAWPPRPEAAIELIDEPPAVLLPAGCRVDLGGIGKGHAADLVVDALRAEGATQVQIELGGDVRVHGLPWHGERWTVEVEDPRDRDRTVATIALREGAVATSSVLRRRWIRDGEVSHHLIDPRTMRPAETDLVAVTAVAATAWRAEVAAKCALIAGRAGAQEVFADLGATGLLFGDDPSIEELTA